MIKWQLRLKIDFNDLFAQIAFFLLSTRVFVYSVSKIRLWDLEEIHKAFTFEIASQNPSL